MAFPISPIDGQIIVENGIAYTYDLANESWYRSGQSSANVVVTDTATISSNTASTSTTTGALTVAGGAGVAGNVYVGAVYTDSYFYANGTPYSTAGALGYSGSIGYTGSVGDIGTTGYTGSKGDTGLGFAIAKTYSTVAALTADTSPTGIAAGEFALIETGSVEDADNSRLYLWSGTAYSYVTDLSGAAGITGPAGATGYTGSAGSTGSTGYTGSSGTNGTDGYTGSVGFTGSTGVGYTGSAGTDGTVGYTGSAGVGSTSTVTTGNTSPVSPSIGDWWYYTVTDTLLQYTNVGNGTYWIDVSGPTYNFGTSASTQASIAESASRNLEVISTSGAPFVLTGIGATENRMTGYSTNRSNNATGISVVSVLTTGTVYWSFSVSSEGNYDFLTVTSSSQGQIYRASGSNTTTGSYSAVAGETITLAYSKDNSDASGADTGYVNYLYVL